MRTYKQPRSWSSVVNSPGALLGPPAEPPADFRYMYALMMMVVVVMMMTNVNY